MDASLFPTKGNLIQSKSTLKLAKQGYELLDKKRNILIREMMSLIEKAEEIQSNIDETFKIAYKALQTANIKMGISEVEQIGYAINEDTDIELKKRSVMGVEIPIIDYKKKNVTPNFGFSRTNIALDEAYQKFNKVKQLSVELAEIENTVYKLAENVKRTQKRANALKNILIPKYEKVSKFIQDYLEEKEREEFTRLKLIKEFNDR